MKCCNMAPAGWLGQLGCWIVQMWHSSSVILALAGQDSGQGNVETVMMGTLMVMDTFILQVYLLYV